MLMKTYVSIRVAAGDLRSRLHERLADLMGSEDGATAAEYGVLVSLIAAVIIAGATLLGDNTNSKLTNVGTTIGP